MRTYSSLFISGAVAAVAVAGSANATLTISTIDNFGVAITGQGNGSFTTLNTITGPFTGRSAYNYAASLAAGASSIAGTGNGVASLSVAQDAVFATGGAALYYLNGSLDLSWSGSYFSLTIGNLVNPGLARVMVAVNNFNSGGTQTVSSNGVLTFSRASIEAGMAPSTTNWGSITSVKVYFYGAGGGSGTSTFQVSNFQAVPAPGAIALLGAAGLVGSRRRRS